MSRHAFGPRIPGGAITRDNFQKSYPCRVRVRDVHSNSQAFDFTNQSFGPDQGHAVEKDQEGSPFKAPQPRMANTNCSLSFAIAPDRNRS